MVVIKVGFKVGFWQKKNLPFNVNEFLCVHMCVVAGVVW